MLNLQGTVSCPTQALFTAVKALTLMGQQNQSCKADIRPDWNYHCIISCPSYCFLLKEKTSCSNMGSSDPALVRNLQCEGQPFSSVMWAWIHKAFGLMLFWCWSAWKNYSFHALKTGYNRTRSHFAPCNHHVTHKKEKVSSCRHADLLGKASSWSCLPKDKPKHQKPIISCKQSFYEMNYEL